MKKLAPFIALVAVFPKFALAHCPLCTIGAGVLAVFAASIGVSSMVVGIMIGAFALALGLWIGKMPKRQYIPLQYPILAFLIYLSTIVPIMPLIVDYGPLYISWWGDYGSFFNRTYTINLFVAGALLGAVLLLAAPYMSRLMTRMRDGKHFPYQGISITFGLLIVAATIIQLFS